jgi:membrane associated rhomboid family serine protease
MGIEDRTYMYGEQPSGRPRVSWGLPRPGRTVKYLVIVNVAVFVLQMILQGMGIDLADWLGVTAASFYQLWRYLTFQFLHSTQSLWHIIFNMLALYFFGTSLERHWGPRRFLRFYLLCGAAAGLAYVLMGALLVGGGWQTPLIGASGGVYAIVLACAVLLPHLQMVFVFIPVPIRLGAAIVFGYMLYATFGALAGSGAAEGFWSDVAHLGGAAAAAGYLLAGRVRGRGSIRLPRLLKPSSGTWRRKLEREQQEDQMIDGILRKIHEHGIASLTHKERRILQDATRRQRERENT